MPDIPLPTITKSAVGGREDVVLWPKRNLEGSRCQNAFVEFAVGSPAWPEDRSWDTIFGIKTMLDVAVAVLWVPDKVQPWPSV